MSKYILAFYLIAISFSIFAQDKESEKWNVNNPTDKIKHVEFTVTEGTWMNLDVSPNGKTIIFDMLGDIYTMPITGGTAKALRTGLAWEVQPRFSPNGKQILFTSDAGGGDNIWVMDANGENAKQVTKESFRLLNNPAWMPNGEYFIARKHFTSKRSLGAGEMWMYHISGGAGIEITKRKNDQQDVNEPCVSSDGRYIYFSEDIYPGGYFQYNKDPNKQIFIIKRYDRDEGKVENIVTGTGGSFRPQIAHNGQWIAYIKRIRTKTILFVQNLDTGEAFPIFEGLSKDQQEAWTIFGIYTGFAWTPDDKNIVIWGKGKIWNINVDTKKATEIPFKVNAKHDLVETLLFKQQVFEEKFKVKAIRQTITSPNEKYIIFNAMGYLWKKNLPNGKPKRLTNGTDFEFEPKFSPNGNSLIFVTWNDETMGKIIKMNLNSKKITNLTTEKGIFRTPSYSNDGKYIVYRKEGGNMHQGYLFSKKPGIYTMDSNGQNVKLVTKEGQNPVFNTKGDRIFYQTGGYIFGSLKKGFHSVDLDGKDKKTIFTSKYATQFTASPDNKWIAFSDLHKVYVAKMPLHGKSMEMGANIKSVPVAQVARDAGIALHWSKDSKSIHWTLGSTYFSNPLTERFTFLEGAVDSIPPMDSTGIDIGLMANYDIPKGLIALTNARIITMERDKVIANGTIIIEGNKIINISESAIEIPKKATIIDCTGKTVMPGIIDAHAHLGAFRYGLSPQKHWQYYTNLAFGVTTTHDPSSNSEMTFSQSEMVKSGNMIGPRIFTTGTILYGADGDFKAPIESLEDARSALRRTKAFGAFSVKSYNQPRREQRQQIIKAARELKMNVYPEGGSFFYHNMSMVADGHTCIEHNIPVAPLYDDVIQFWSSTNTKNTPTLIVNYGGLNGEYYWYQHTNVWENKKLLTFTPRPIIDSRSRHRTMVPEEEYENGHILVSKSCKKLNDAGVGIQLGAHGQIQGIGAHWELWMLAQGGMSHLQALKAATINGAIDLGMEDEIGSLKEGKLADLIILDKNPLENIRNSNSIKYTIINGRIFDSTTMNEIGNHPRKRTPFYWELEGSANYFPFDMKTNGCMVPGCGCQRN